MGDAAARMGRQMARRNSRLLLYSFPSAHLVPHSLCGSLPCFLTSVRFLGIHPPLFLSRSFFEVCGVRLDGTSHPSGSRSTEKRELLSSATPVPQGGTQKIFGSRPCPNRVSQDPWLLANPSWLTAWAVKMVMTLSGWGGTDDQSGLVVSHQPLCVVLRSSPLLIQITFLVETAPDLSSHSKPPWPAYAPTHCVPPPHSFCSSSAGNRPVPPDRAAEQIPRPPNMPTLNIYSHSSDSPSPSTSHCSSTGSAPSDNTIHSLPPSEIG
jgi:hypothetical protein